MSQGQRRRRAVASCIPCYSKKQKCNRQYPCSNCTRRRRPELCAYMPIPAKAQISPPGSCAVSDGLGVIDHARKDDLEEVNHREGDTEDFVDRFGYFTDSSCNSLGLLRQHGLNEESPRSIPATIIERDWQQLPARPILDFLIQYFINEVNWIVQLLHPPRFLAEYEKWRNGSGPDEMSMLVTDVEFTVLVLRISAYTSHFLPSPSYMVDTIRGVPLSEVRSKCTEIGNHLAMITTRACSMGSLTRVLHLSFEALSYECEGRLTVLWSRLGDAIKAAQSVGLHRETSRSTAMDELERELRRRTMWNLAIFDQRLSRSLDRVPFLDLSFCTTDLPRMRLTCDMDDTNAPEPFTERLTQARLVQFWSTVKTGSSDSSYECNAAEARYEKLFSEFLPTVPGPFALEPDTSWDERLPLLPRQRQLFRLAVYDHIVQNFRPLLTLDEMHCPEMTKETQALLNKQRRTLARAGIGMLQCVAALHSLLGQGHTRLSLITFHTFEASVVLVSLLLSSQTNAINRLILDDTLDDIYLSDPLSIIIPDASRAGCMHAVGEALRRLEMLANGSALAELAAKKLALLFDKVKYLEQPAFSLPATSYDSPSTLDFSNPPSSLGDSDELDRQGLVALDCLPWPTPDMEFFWQEPVLDIDAFPLQFTGPMDLGFTN